MAKEFIKKYYFLICCLGFAATICSMFISYTLFQDHADIAMIFLTTIALSPFVYYTIKIEEKFDFSHKKELLNIKHHFPIFLLYMVLFLGSFLGFIVAFLLLPERFVLTLFDSQLFAIGGSLGYTSFLEGIFGIFFTNARILLFCIILSLFFGVGALIIILWNASVLAVVIGDILREYITNSTPLFGAFSVFFLFGIHGFFEILAYFIGGFAGGVISIAIIRHHYSSKKFLYVIKDATVLVILSVILLFIAAVLEILL